MDLDRSAFIAALDAAQPRLAQDRVVQLAQWDQSIPHIVQVIREAAAACDSYEELFRRLHDDDTHTDARYLYATMLILRDDPTLAPRQDEQSEGDLSLQPDEMLVVFGSALITGSMKWTSGALIVLGDLTIQGIYADIAFTDSQLLVGGSMRVRGMETFGEALISNDLDAPEIVYGVANDHSLRVGGSLQTRCLLVQYHHVAATNIHAQTTLEEYKDIEQLRNMLVPDLVLPYDDNGTTGYELDGAALVERMAEGQPIYR